DVKEGTRAAMKIAGNVGGNVAGEVADEMAGEPGNEHPAVPLVPVVIDLPSTVRTAVRFTMSDEQHAQLEQIHKLGMELGGRGKELNPAEREAMQKQLADAQAAFEKSMRERTAQLSAQMQTLMKAREEA